MHATKMLSANFILALNPQIVKSYSQENYERFFELIYRGSKMAFFILLALSFPIVNHLSELLELWLGRCRVPQHTEEFTLLLIVIAFVNALSDPLVTAVSSNGNIKWFQIVSGISLFMILPISGIIFCFVHRPIAIFIVYLLMSMAVYLYRLWYCNRLLGLSFYQYIQYVWRYVFLVLISSIFLHVLYVKVVYVSGILMFVSMLLEFLLIIGLIIIAGLTKSERVILYEYVRKFI